MSYVVKNIGLVTYNNELDSSEGSLVVAENVVVDEPGVVSLRRGFKDYGDNLPVGDDRAKQLILYKNRLIRHFDNTLQWDSGSGVFTPFQGIYEEIEAGIRIKSQEANGNLYFTTTEGIKKLALKNSSQYPTTNIINAGAVKAVDLETKTKYVQGGFLPPQSKVAYRILYGYKDVNNNLILGSPSLRSTSTNSSAETLTFEQSTVTFTGGPAASNYFILSTDVNKYTLWFDTTGSDPEPSAANTIGTTKIKVTTSGSVVPSELSVFLANVVSTSIQEVRVSANAGATTITNNSSGDVFDIAAGTLSNVTVATLVQGSVTEGNFADIELTFTLPNEINTTYFYQVYRTSVLEDTEGIGLDQIEPGDDMNLVIESPVTMTDIENGFITVIDDTPELFRISGTALYTSPNLGEGILRANERPPIAKDIELFRNSVFYGNTKTSHSIQLNLLTVNNLINSTSEITIANNEGFTSYTFYGVPEVSDITVDTRSNTVDASWILINSGNNETKYYVYFAKTDSTAAPDVTMYPELEERIGIRINLYLYDDTLSGTKEALVDAIEFLQDFSIEETVSGVRITNVNNGSTDDSALGAVSPGGAWASSTFQQGDGEGIKQNILSITTGVTTTFEVSSHGLETGDLVTFLQTDLSITQLDEVYAITVVDEDNFTINVDTSLDSVVTNGQVFQRQVLISSLVSTAQAIDQTARSLVKIINKDPLSVVNAYYLSGPDDLPGIIRLEAKNLNDNPFYLAVNDSSLSASFSPEVPSIETITDITFSSGANSPALITAAGHGLFTNDEVFIYALDTVPVIAGSFVVEVVDPNSFTINFNITGEDSPSTNAFFIKSSAKSDNLTSPNRIYYSKLGQPEAVPQLNYLDIGEKDEPIERILALRDNLFVLKTDGIYIITGSSEPNFTARLIDNNAIILAPDSAVVLNNLIYMLSTQGVVYVNEASPGIISRVIEDKINFFTRPSFSYRTSCFGVAYERDRAYLLWCPSEVDDEYATQTYRYNTFERVWTRWTIEATCGIVSSSVDKMYLGSGDKNTILEERKNSDRTDHADREVPLSIQADAYLESKKRLKVSTLQGVEIGDVIYQDQYVTLATFNRLLRKLDLDPGLDTDYSELLTAFAGDSITNAIQNLNDKLVLDDSSGSVTAKVISDTPTTYLSQFNLIIEELNDISCDTVYKNYKEVDYITPYETLIVDIIKQGNIVVLAHNTPFIVGDITLFKAIKSEIEWNPIHFGDPSMLKQVREGTIMFDQGNFYGGTLGYSSDLSQEFIDQKFSMSGPGYFGYGVYAEDKFYYGGQGNDAPYRAIVPSGKQKCRTLSVRFIHSNAREGYKITGISFNIRQISTRAYR